MIALVVWLAAAFAAPAPAVGAETSAATAPTAAAAPMTAITAGLVLKVGEPQESSDALVAEAKRLGGWFQSRDDSTVGLRVPVAQIDALLAFAKTQGLVADESYQAEDLGETYDRLGVKLKSRQETLSRYYEVLGSAKADSVVSVAQQITRLIEQMEGLQGQMKVLDNRARYAQLSVSFQFRDRRAPVNDGSSPFAWLNTLNLDELVQSFRWGDAYWKSSGVIVADPAGFSAWKKRSHYRAATPDEVVFRARTVKNKPAAELAFWKEALKDRMVNAGYTVVSEQDVTANGTPGTLLEVTAPLWTDDWTYVIAVFPSGNKLVLVESAGEVTRFAARREAVLAAIAALQP